MERFPAVQTLGLPDTDHPAVTDDRAPDDPAPSRAHDAPRASGYDGGQPTGRPSHVAAGVDDTERDWRCKEPDEWLLHRAHAVTLTLSAARNLAGGAAAERLDDAIAELEDVIHLMRRNLPQGHAPRRHSERGV